MSFSPAALAAIAKVQILDQNQAGYFAVAMVGLFGIFTALRWLRFTRPRSKSHDGKVAMVVRISRNLRAVLLRSTYGFTSTGHALLFITYLVINVILMVTRIDFSELLNVGKRLGWLAVCNLTLITFLALKNTPLAFLTAYSYERLNPLHQLAGYTTITCMLLHGIIQLVALHQSDEIFIMRETASWVGGIAATAALVILVTSLLLRKLRYEVFYVIHIVMYMLILIAVGLHRPDFATKTLIIVTIAAGLWLSDRLVRAGRMVNNLSGNRVTVTSLPHNGVRVTLCRPLWRAAPGSHAFLWIPGIRALETHPFTMVSTNPVEMVIKAHDGFTKDLHAYAVRHPGGTLRASIDGPYGTLPDFLDFDRIVLVAGGSGASFIFGVALKVISQATLPTFVYSNTLLAEMISWFRPEFEELEVSPLVQMNVYLTRSTSDSPLSASAGRTASNSSAELSVEKQRSAGDEELDVGAYASEKKVISDVRATGRSTQFQVGRPHVRTVIEQAVGRADPSDRVVVAGCGPTLLMKGIRRTVAACVARRDGPSIELHCEEFGW
ncbi:MAG: hypothetical protein M1818_007481 [Claussenomyces sp. TS43310]|nr:MAG: hypothetical protein M1818_007481 [Claussenomyces sp. TS43310]